MSDTPASSADQPSNADAPATPVKVSRWDRPKPPHDWRWIVGGFGRALITLGLLMFGFVGYQLWGTGIQTAQAQRSLSKDFNRQIAAVSTTTLPATTTTVEVTTTTEPASTTLPTEPSTTTSTVPALPTAQPVPEEGEAVARLEIPRIDLNRIVVEGASAEDLEKGPAHFPETPLPGQLGNSAIAGHRTTYLHPFLDIDDLQPGDEIIATTLNGRYVYSVTGTEIVSPDDYDAVIPTENPNKATLTLVSCTPKYSASKRIVVHSELVAEQSDQLTQPLADPTVDTTVDTGTPAETLPDETLPGESTISITSVPDPTTASSAPPTSAAPTTEPERSSAGITPPEGFTDGWFSDPASIPQALLWGALLAGIAYGIYWLSRKVRRYWVGILAGVAPFVVALYFFYENVNRLLPPNL